MFLISYLFSIFTDTMQKCMKQASYWCCFVKNLQNKNVAADLRVLWVCCFFEVSVMYENNIYIEGNRIPFGDGTIRLHRIKNRDDKHIRVYRKREETGEILSNQIY